MQPSVYDQASRFAARIDSAGFLGWLLGLSQDQLGFRGWLDTRGVAFPGDPDRTGDTIARLDCPCANGIPWAVAVEFQARPDADMFGRMLGYLSGLWLGLRPDQERGSRFEVGAAVVNLTGQGAASRRMEWPGTRLRSELQVVERNLEAESAEEVLADVESGRWSWCVLVWVPLMAGADTPEVVERWLGLAGAIPDRRRRADLAGLAGVFSERAGRKDLWQEKLRGWDVEESTVVNEWMARWEARGEARGRAEGRAAEAQAITLRLGVRRFGPAPAGVEDAIRGIIDHDRLERMAERTLDATGWDDLLTTP